MNKFGYNESEYKVFRKYAWRYLVLFSLLYCFLYCTRLNLSNAAAVIMADLHWTKADIGILTGTLFWTYGLGQLINGRLSEIVGPTKFVVLSVLLSVIANVLLSFQTSIVIMAIIWGANGYFQSMGWTPGLATLTKWWPGNTRGFATGFAHAFSGFGQVAATLSVAFAFIALPQMGWRAAFLIPAALPLVMLIIYFFFAKISPKEIGLKEYVETDPEKAKNEEEMKAIIKEHGALYPYKYVLNNGRFITWMFVAFATGLSRYGLVTWVPLYFIDQFNVNITSGLLASLALPVGMGIGTLVVPWLTDHFYPTNRLPAVVQSAVIGAIAIFVFFTLDPRVPAQLIAIEVLLFVAGFCIYAINGIVWAFATDVGGRMFSGTSGGVLNFAAYMGAAIQSFFYGFMLDRGGWSLVFISLTGFLVLIALLGIFSSNKRKTI